MSRFDQTLLLRTKEIIDNSTESILVRDAMKQALLERYQTREAMADAAVSFADGVMKELRKASYVLPDDSQGRLFQLPPSIWIHTPDGEKYINRDEATMGEVRQWLREGIKYHAVQGMRFARFKEGLQVLEDVDDDVLWTEARNALAERSLAELESDE